MYTYILTPNTFFLEHLQIPTKIYRNSKKRRWQCPFFFVNILKFTNFNSQKFWIKISTMERKNYDTVSEAISDLQKQGYTVDFSIMADKECLVCHKTTSELSPDDFEIDQFYRFEGNTDPGDEMIVYAISSTKNNLKGIVVNAFGIYADSTSSAVVKKLNAHLKQ